MNKDFIENLKIEVLNSEIDKDLKEWFLTSISNNTLLEKGYDYSGRVKNSETIIEYYVITNADNDYQIVYSTDLKKFGVKCEGHESYSVGYPQHLKKVGLTRYVLSWSDNIIDALKYI